MRKLDVANSSKRKNRSGFTIIEIIIIIVVISILTALTVVSYKGITDRSHILTLQNDLSNATTQLNKYNYEHGSYPAALSDTNDGTGLKTTNGAAYVYELNSSDNSYCLSGSSHGYTYYVLSDNNKPKEGSCP